jgi:uncharacterized protein YjlB
VSPVLVEAEGVWPNNGRLPLLVYRAAFDLGGGDPAAAIEAVLDANGWDHGWRDGVLGYHHYHSTAHEVLGVYGGSARIQLGGPAGPVLEAGRGDVLVLPAGVAHRRLEASPDFRVVGHYPRGQHHDMCYGEPGERPAADGRIGSVPLPPADPVYGPDGPLAIHWGLREA